MEAIEILMAEHRLILRGIDALVAFAEEARRGGGDRAELRRFVTFIREYADGLHHGKEEDVLFAAMVEAGFPAQAGPIAVMLHEHDLGRRHVAELSALAVGDAPFAAAEAERLHDAALGYAGLLRGHIHKEDAVLYPMAEQRLPASLQARVDEGCVAFEAARDEDGTRARLERLGAELSARHAPGLAAASNG
jgi:hemerythrin-like domain-containing protein